MVRAATNHVVDFSKFDPRSSFDWHRLRIVLNDLDRQMTADLLKLRHMEEASSMIARWRTSDGARRSQYITDLAEMRKDVVSLISPWILLDPELEKDEQTKIFEAMYAQYKEMAAAGLINDGSKPVK